MNAAVDNTCSTWKGHWREDGALVYECCCGNPEHTVVATKEEAAKLPHRPRLRARLKKLGYSVSTEKE